VTDGGKYLASNGYGELINLEKQSNLASLVNSPENKDNLAQTGNASPSWLVILIAVIATGILLLLSVRVFAVRKRAATKEEKMGTPAFTTKIVPGPEGLYYDKTHTWTFLEKDGHIRVGIDDFLQHATGTITRVIMKEPGETLRRGEKILTLTKFGKQLNLYSPVSGTIKARNVNLQENSSLVNTSPFADGWVYLVEPKNWLRELQFMMMAEKHREWLKDEYARLRNFFEGTLKTQHATFEFAVLQDGGELRDNLLADLGPEVWEEFQKRFIDASR
jgi:LPXTG-motif cell wall-anchored protein